MQCITLHFTEPSIQERKKQDSLFCSVLQSHFQRIWVLYVSDSSGHFVLQCVAVRYRVLQSVAVRDTWVPKKANL